MYKQISEHVSKDSKLTLLLVNYEDDWIIGFKECQWHTHGDMLMPTYGNAPGEAAKNFMNSILHDKEIIIISEIPNLPTLIQITNQPEDEIKYKEPDEVIDLRYWSGKKYKAQTNNNNVQNNTPEIL